MGDALVERQLKFGSEPKTEERGAIELINETHTSELIIGLCGPIGSRIHKSAGIIERVLIDKYHYECHHIKLSDFISEYGNCPETKSSFERRKLFIEQGNKLREENGAEFLAACAIHRILGDRTELKDEVGASRYEDRRICYIIDSIKNKYELRILEAVYNDIFYCFGVFSTRDQRVANLELEMSSSEVFQLIDRDSGEEIDYGQSVEDTFPLADFFIRDDEDRDPLIEKKVERAFNIIFEDKIITPTRDESAMYHAAAAASNSSCMSRQVGACITNSQGAVLSVGWNEAPKAFGGVYSEDDGDEASRCFQLGGECQNKIRRDKLGEEITNTLFSAGLLDKDNVKKALKLLEDTRVDSLIEFSRSIHAEMNAIILGAQKSGDKMVGGKLYCTTFPCHNCARHIILAGINEVYYIEPYQKSLALELHKDALTENSKEEAKVRLCLFDGVAPARYMDFFLNNRSRKDDDGMLPSYSAKKTSPSKTISLESIPALEGLVVKKLVNLGVIEGLENE